MRGHLNTDVQAGLELETLCSRERYLNRSATAILIVLGKVTPGKAPPPHPGKLPLEISSLGKVFPLGLGLGLPGLRLLGLGLLGLGLLGLRPLTPNRNCNPNLTLTLTPRGDFS